MKNFSITRIRQIFPNFNRTPVTEIQFWKICKRFKIVVRSIPLGLVDGYHERKKGRNYIIINSKLKGDKWLHTALHELCHYLFDAPDHGDYVFYRTPDGCGKLEPDPLEPEEKKRRRKQREKFADAFGLACMIPYSEAVQLTREDHGDSPNLSLYAARIEAISEFKF